MNAPARVLSWGRGSTATDRIDVLPKNKSRGTKSSRTATTNGVGWVVGP